MLAFLSNIEDDQHYIPAVCLQENPLSGCLSVLLAVNKSKRDDGSHVLLKLKVGFENIFAILLGMHGDLSNAEDDVFAAIVSMCSARIKYRLRLVASLGNTQKKQNFTEHLHKIISYLRHPVTKLPDELAAIAVLLVERAKDVAKLADSWVKHQTLIRLGELVEGVYRLWKIGGLRQLFDTIPNRSIDPTLRSSLLNIFSKVTRYREAARYLYRLAKKSAPIRELQLILVDLPQEAFRASQLNERPPNFGSTISRISTSKKQGNLGHFCRLMKKDELEASNDFARHMKKALEGAKIHAEIRLLFYCELQATKLPPRVICSSKDACFLCNTLILMHGKIHVPRSHGRIYPGWRLPNIPELDSLQRRFNEVLGDYARSSIKMLLSRRRQTNYPDPNESTLLTLSTISKSTLLSVLSSVAIVENGDDAVHSRPISHTDAIRSDSILYNAQAPSEALANTPKSVSTACTEAAVARPNQDVIDPVPLNNTAPQSNSSVESNCDGLSSTVDDGYVLSRGHGVSRSIGIGQRSGFYNARRLEIQFDYSTQSDLVMSNVAPERVAYGMKWLTDPEVEALQENLTTSVIDLESLKGEMSYELDKAHCLYIAAYGLVVRLHLPNA